VSLEGEHRDFEHVGDSRQWARYLFCPTCGSTVAYRNEDAPGVVTVLAGAFADPDFPVPERSIFERSQHHWVQIDGAGVQHLPDGQ